MDYTIIHGGGWFITCIMIYYIILYFIQRFCLNQLKWVFGIAALISVIWYLIIDCPSDYNMYGNTYFKWCHYFLFMLLGAMIGISKRNWSFNLKLDLFKLFICTIVFYAILFAGRKIVTINEWQIISLFPLLGITFYFYKICNSQLLKKWYEHRISGWIIKFIGGLCLEIYLIQGVFFTNKLNNIFPLNILIIFFAIIIAAYILRCTARTFSQTFKDGEYDWKAVFKFV